MSSTENEQGGFSQREICIYKNLWRIHPGEIKKLSKFFLMWSEVPEFLNAVHDTHPYRDYLMCEGTQYEVRYIDCSYYSIETLIGNEKLLLLSFRQARNNDLAVVLCTVLDTNSAATAAFREKYGQYKGE